MRRTFRAGVLTFTMLLLSLVATRAQQPQPPANCAPLVVPVCAVKEGTRQSYWNECLARRDGALVVRTGECPNTRSYN